MKIYWAAPLFSLTERKVNRALARAVAGSILGAEVLLPQDLKPKKNGKPHSDEPDAASIFEACRRGIDKADLIVANLDGSDADSGTCWEVGYAFALGKPIIGVRTDYRPNQDDGVNLMLARSCSKWVHHLGFDENVVALAKDIVRAIRAVQKGIRLKEARHEGRSS